MDEKHDLELASPPHGLNDEVNFGKHKGDRIKDVIYDDVTYIKWLLENVGHFELDKDAMDYYENTWDAHNESESENDTYSFFYDENY